MDDGSLMRYRQADAATRRQGMREQNCAIGVANTMETVHWLYNKHFSAVASDTLSFEAWPYPEGCCLHEWLLCQWGTPIGELWDLEQLSRTCASLGKWSFFLTSAPLHIKGGIGSPPNAIAIF
jgi:kynurenine formamidase